MLASCGDLFGLSKEYWLRQVRLNYMLGRQAPDLYIENGVTKNSLRASVTISRAGDIFEAIPS